MWSTIRGFASIVDVLDEQEANRDRTDHLLSRPWQLERSAYVELRDPVVPFLLLRVVEIHVRHRVPPLFGLLLFSHVVATIVRSDWACPAETVFPFCV